MVGESTRSSVVAGEVSALRRVDSSAGGTVVFNVSDGTFSSTSGFDATLFATGWAEATTSWR